MNRIIWFGVVIAMLAVGGWWYFNHSSKSPTSETALMPVLQEGTVEGGSADISQTKTSKPVQSDPKTGYVMEIAERDGHRQITNPALGIQFSVPDSFWRVGSNNLGAAGGGHFQIFNYPEPEVGDTRWYPGRNKIEMFVIDDPASFVSGTMTTVEIAGQRAFRGEGEYKNSVSYVVPLRTIPGKYITLTIYGDSKNYSILDTVIATLSVQ